MRKLEDGTVKVDSDGEGAHKFALLVFRAIVVATVLGLGFFIYRTLA